MQDADKGSPIELNGQDLRIGIVQARFNAEITAALAKSCIAELEALGVSERHIRHVTVPGALSTALLHFEGSVSSNAPRKLAAKTTSMRKKKMLNTAFVASELRALAPKMPVMMRPSAT